MLVVGHKAKARPLLQKAADDGSSTAAFHIGAVMISVALREGVVVRARMLFDRCAVLRTVATLLAYTN